MGDHFPQRCVLTPNLRDIASLKLIEPDDMLSTGVHGNFPSRKFVGIAAFHGSYIGLLLGT